MSQDLRGAEQDELSFDALEDLDDVRLIERLRSGDERCAELLLSRYRGLARAQARSYFLTGCDKEDVVQEAMIGLFKAIRDFDPSQGVPFKAFAELCVSRQILSSIRGANRRKHHPLNTSVSFDAPAFPGGDASGFVGEFLAASPLADPALLVESAEEVEAIRDVLTGTLTDLEREVLGLYMDGKSYGEIAGTLNSHLKAVDNALQRVKLKIRKHIVRRRLGPA